MNKKTKSILLSTIIVSGIGLASTGSALAANTNSQQPNGNGNCQTMTTEQKEARESEMKTRLEERLSADVSSGKITEEQKSHILEIEDQIHTKMEANDKTGADKLRDELRAWETEQNIASSLHQGSNQGLRERNGANHWQNNNSNNS